MEEAGADEVAAATRAVAARQSLLAVELRRLPDSLRDRLGAEPVVVAVIDALVRVARLLVDDADPRPVSERLADLEEMFPNFEQGLEQFQAGLARIDEQQLAKRFQSQNYLDFARRLVGAARYHRLAAAARVDGAVVGVAVRRALRFVMPLATAMDNCVAVLSPDQVKAVLPSSMPSTLGLLVELDKLLDQVVGTGLPTAVLPLRAGEEAALDVDLDDLAEKLRRLLQIRTDEQLAEVSGRLARKIRGARDVLDVSADAVSQSANSMIELVDRLLRHAHSDAEVLAWVARNQPDRSELLFHDSRTGQLRPTKRAQALCFVHAGANLDQPSPLHELIALSLVVARNELQALKHADAGSEEEQAELLRLMAAVEGYLAMCFQVSWLVAEDEQVGRLRARLAG